MPELTEPLLAPRKLPKQIRFPVYASPKIDGIRALVRDGVVLSRKLKPIPNAYVQTLFAKHELHGLDGELVVGEPNVANCMQATTSGVMSRDGEPAVTYYVFDVWNKPAEPYAQRYRDLCLRAHTLPAGVVVLPQTQLTTQAKLDDFEQEHLAVGYEGVMVRDPLGRYKYGRSTEREGLLLKVKRFQDDEAEVIGVVELQHNDNEATTDATGHTKRSSSKVGKRAAGMLGALVVRDLKSGVEFEIGTGFTREQRVQLWEDHFEQPEGDLRGRVVTYKHFAAAGVKDKPRFPVFKAFRDRIDL